jgi:nucleoid-associated protein YgaU
VDRRKKILLVAAVLIAGLIGALQFRKSEFVQSHFPAASGWHFGPSTTPTSDQTAATPRSDNSNGPQTTAFDGHIEAAPGTKLEPVDQPVATASNTNSSTGPLIDVNVPDQTYTIIDGDTLQGLSQHYLGRADRYMELFQYNRDVLRSPDELPIGAELRIPAQVALPQISGAAALPSVPSTPLTSLVPLPQTPATAPPAVAGKTTLPVSAQAQSQVLQNPLRPNQRTYTVQAGDNLVDIARKFYGDGRRYESIYEANRRVMHNPTDLKPGMVLAIP